MTPRGGRREWAACEGSGREPVSITFAPDPPTAYAFEGVCEVCGRITVLVKAKRGASGFKVMRHGEKT